MLWLLMVSWFVLSVTLRHPEIIGGDKLTEGVRPELSKLALKLLPQHGIAILLFMPGAALGFAAVTMVAGESLSSRLFRWLIVLLATGVFTAFLPLADRVMLLGREIDSAVFDWSEALAAIAGLAMAFAGVWHAHRNWR